MSSKRAKGSLLSKQEIAVRKKQLAAKKMSTPAAPNRAIVGVAVLALSVMSFLSVVTFDVHDRVGPGFHNLIGPVGHAIAEALRGLFGICAVVLPIVGIYGSSILFVGDKTKRRWPQMLSLGLLLTSFSVLAQLLFKEDASWAHAPGGVLGRSVGGVMTALFSTVGTVVLVSAIATVAFIVGTQFAFLRFCAWASERAVAAFIWGKAAFAKFLDDQKANAKVRQEKAEKAKEEEAAFLASLEEEEAELAELEAAANEAELVAQEAERVEREHQNSKLADAAEKERLKADRERAQMEREAARLAREALKTARQNEKENRRAAAAALAPTLITDAKSQPAGQISGIGNEPAWAMAFNLAPQQQPAQPPPPPADMSQPPPRRVPTIVEPMPQGEKLTQAALSESIVAPENLSPLDSRGPESRQAVSMPPSPAGAIATAAETTALATMAPAGATALAKMPLIVEPKAPPKPTKKKEEKFQFVGDRTSFQVPPLDVLEVQHTERATIDKDAFLSTAEKLTAKLKDFGIDGEVVEIRPGPVVTMYEFKPAAGVKISRIASLSDDLAMAMEAMRVRIVAPIPGKGVVGIEVPNKKREMVFLKEIAEQDAFQKSQSRLTMCLGKDIEGMPYILDLAKAPHLLMAGTTGSGKSVSVNAMIMSILLKSTPEEVRFIMVDPKMLELSVYEGIPHLLLPVVTDPRKAAVALQWAVDEMTRRYRLLADAGVRNIAGYNTMVEQEAAKKKASKSVIDAKPKVMKPAEAAPVIPNKEPEAPAAVAAAPTPTPTETPAVDAKDAKRKKRRMLIVDVADGSNAESAEAAVAEGSIAAPATTSPLDIGVAAPKEALEDPREQVEAEVTASNVLHKKEVEAAATETEIRVEEPAGAESEQEAAALAEAASVPVGAAPDEKEEKTKLPYIVVIIDELADLMMVASKEVETSIARLAQMARAAGIHLMVATQRPSTDVVTGIIKANFPTRISFMLRSKPDSMTILGTIGAEALLGMGDMLIMPPTSAHLQRVHGCFVSEGEIKKVVDHLKAQGTPVYDESILKPREDEGATDGGEEDELSDELYDQAVAIVSEMKTVSISMLQRKMRIGYNRAARMIERMERDGMVGAADGAKPREVLIRPVGQMPGAGMMG